MIFLIHCDKTAMSAYNYQTEIQQAYIYQD